MEQVLASLTTIVGLFLGVGAPILKLSSTITKITVRMDAMENVQKSTIDNVKEVADKNRDAHKHIHNRIDNVEKDVNELKSNRK